MALKLDSAKFARKMKRIGKDITRKVAAPAVDSTIDRLARDAKNIVPVDTGELRKSINRDVDVGVSRVEGTVYSDIDYAPFVHEDLDAFHPNGQNKFIEKPFRKTTARELVRQTKKYFGRLR